MLFPISNKFRSVTSLNGIWRFNTVPDGYDASVPLKHGFPMAVPASMNEIVTDVSVQNHVGLVVYERYFSLPVVDGNEYRLRIGATSHRCEVYLNGRLIGEAESGFLPIDLPLDALEDSNRLTVVIDNRLTAQTFPAGRIRGGKQAIKFDFYNFTGIHRDVAVYSRPKKHVDDVSIETVVGGDYGKIKVDVSGEFEKMCLCVLDADGCEVACREGCGELTVDTPRLWSPDEPYLYTLVISTECDAYSQRFGIRSVCVDGDRLLLNGKPIYLKGFGMHEDFFILGKGLCSALNVRNFELLRWIGANSVRTSHYPYSDEFMDLADEYGILVIDEVPAVGMNWWDEVEGESDYGDRGVDARTLALHKRLISRLYDRDKNHPCVIMMSVANESATNSPQAGDYYREVIGHAKSVWSVPVTIVEFYGANDTQASQYVDVLCINRYFGWYYDHGELDVIRGQMTAELELWHDVFGKPIIVAEFGADTVEGLHALPAETFSEEFQRDYIEQCCLAFDECDFCVGEHVWNFADFKTKQGVNRVRGNRKGVFTKERQPKLAAHYLRERWRK